MNAHLLVLGILIPVLAAAATGRTVDIRVVDETGKPIKGAQVLVHSGKENDVTSSGRRGFQEATDADGRWHHEFKPKWGLENIQVFLHEDQPEREVYPIKLEKFISFHRERASYDLTLPRIIHPIALKARWCGFDYNYTFDTDGRMQPRPTPASRKVGFDAELVDWLPPFGKGRQADFYAQITSLQVGWEISERDLAWHRDQKAKSEEELSKIYGIWNNTLELTFPHRGDGISRSLKFWPYCNMKMPHRAPTEGYQEKLHLIQTTQELGSACSISRLDLQVNCGYFLRVRTKLGPGGDVISAHYLKMLSPKACQDGFAATFFFNPIEGDTNLEYSGSNLLWPRPEGETIFDRPPVPFGLDIDDH